MTKTTHIIWNGCDFYRIAEKGEVAYKGSESFKAFPVVEVRVEDLPKGADGESDLTGILGTECGRFFKASSKAERKAKSLLNIRRFG